MKLKGLLCIILLILQSVAFGTEHCEANKVLSVTASKPEGLKNFTSFPFENDFYFVGEREREGAINFKVSLSVQRPDLTLKAPETNPVTKSTNGGVITDYQVVKTAGGEKKISGKVYLVVLSAEICETFKVDDDVVIGVSKGESENPKTKLMAEAVGADDWTATIKLMPDDKSVEILEPTELSKSSNLTNIRITKGYEFEKKEPKKLELTFKIKGKEVKVVKNLDLLPVEVTPDILAVNSDFDEGRIDPGTGYAIPDCDDVPGVDRKTGAGNGELKIETEREHLDGLYANDEHITDDMHKGWFGVLPKHLGDDFWDGATVTIRKIDKIDEDLGRKESGQVRFYAKWGDPKFGTYYGINAYDFNTLQPNNLVRGGVNKRPGEGVYGSSSTIPDDAEFWMEGVRPGKITLEWRLQKGDIDIKYEQTFLVATQQSKQKWIDQVYYQVKLQSKIIADNLNSNPVVPPVLTVYPIDMTKFNPKNGFFKNSKNHNYAYIQRVYYYYQQLFKQNPEEFYWAGMAKTAGASVYAGMGDMHIWWHTPWPFNPNAATKTKLDKVLDDFLVTGNKNIFVDMAWAHHAYVSSGIWALLHIEENFGDGEEPITDFAAWKLIDSGIQDGDAAKLSKGNRDILFREQNVVMPPLYNQMKLVWVKPHSLQWLQETLSGFVAPPTNANGEINMDEAFSLNAQNPIDKGTGPMFRDVVPNGSLSDFNDRWAWIDSPQKGMLQIWMGTATGSPAFDAAKRANFNGLQLYGHAIQYSMSKELPPE